MCVLSQYHIKVTPKCATFLLSRCTNKTLFSNCDRRVTSISVNQHFWPFSCPGMTPTHGMLCGCFLDITIIFYKIKITLYHTLNFILYNFIDNKSAKCQLLSLSPIIHWGGNKLVNLSQTNPSYVGCGFPPKKSGDFIWCLPGEVKIPHMGGG